MDNAKSPDDNTSDNFSVCDVKLMRCLIKHNSLSVLAKKLNRKKPNVHRSLKKLKKRGLVDCRHSLYYLTSFGFQSLNQGCYPSPEGFCGRITPSRIVAERIRLHNLSFTLGFFCVPEGWNRDRARVFGLNLSPDDPFFNSLADNVSGVIVNDKFRGGGCENIRFGDFLVITYASSVRIFMPEIIRDTPEAATGEALRVLFDVVPKIERLLRLPQTALFRDGRLNIRVSSQHFAIFESCFAKYIVRDKRDTRFCVPVNGEARLIVDASEGHFETETVHNRFAGSDMERIKPFFEDILQKDFYLPSESRARMDEITDKLHDFSVHLSAHTNTAKANLAAANALNLAISRFDALFSPFSFVWRVCRRLRLWR